jgi:hypothetical protein
MIDYIFGSAAWSAAGFLVGWFSCRRWQRLERKVEHIEHVVEETQDDHQPTQQ